MKVKILEVKRRNWLARLLSVRHWKVKVEIGGKVYSYNCWAGTNETSTVSLLFDLEQKIKKDFSIGEDLSKLKGKVLEVENGETAIGDLY